MERSYEEAIHCLNSRRAAAKANLDDMRGSDDMVEWLKQLGYSVESLDRLNAIHVAGTNGKGSTCAFIASFLETHGKHSGYPQKVGLYTSPHMNNIRERIRINGQPVSEELFTARFFEIWDKLPNQATTILDIPRYLQLLALLSFHIFITEKVDVAVYETHLGGQYDATNIIETPIVTAITSITMDHVNLLGPKIEDIAWHKAGIFKSGSLALSTTQDQAVTSVLKQRAAEKRVKLNFVGTNNTLPTNATALVPIAQRINCSLALAVVRDWLSFKGQSIVGDYIFQDIEKFSWPGRYQQINQQMNNREYQWFLDAAHNQSGLQYAGKWFAETVDGHTSGGAVPTRILIFSHFSKRDGIALLRSIAVSLKENNIRMNHVILSSYDERRDGQTRIDKNLKNYFSPVMQNKYAEFWQGFDPVATVSCTRTIEEALQRARDVGDRGNGIQALITGSLHLVSGAHYLLEFDFAAIHANDTGATGSVTSS